MIPNYKKIIEEVFKEVQSLLIFYPIKEKANFDNYLNNAKDFSYEVKNNTIFKANSFNISITYASLLIEKGLPDWAIRIISCLTEIGNLHFICSAFGLILDNREINVYYMNQLSYECTNYCKFNDYKNWNKWSTKNVVTI
jgi:hypothetical protein